MGTGKAAPRNPKNNKSYSGLSKEIKTNTYPDNASLYGLLGSTVQ